MRVELLGTGGYHPNERRQTACVMLPEIGVLFDAGTGFFRVPGKLETNEVHIFLSHAHLDHVCGLTYFLVPLMEGTVERAAVYGSEKTLEGVQEHLFAEALFPVQPGYEFIPLSDEVTLPGGVVVRHVPLVSHPGGSTGYRLERGGSSLAYVTDTTVDGSYTEFVRGVDLLIHECYFPDEMAEWAERTGHSSTSQVAQLAVEAGVRRLLLVHADPRRAEEDPIGLETARGIFADTEMGEDGMVVEV